MQPVLANIFAHNAIDVWIEEMVKPACKGTVEMFRYADDSAPRTLTSVSESKELHKRLGKAPRNRRFRRRFQITLSCIGKEPMW